MKHAPLWGGDWSEPFATALGQDLHTSGQEVRKQSMPNGKSQGGKVRLRAIMPTGVCPGG